MEKKTLYLICNAHLDPVWLWNKEEGISAALSTFHTAADFCENYDGFVFNHNEALLYQWIEEYDLPLFERIQKLVKAGKWHIMGGLVPAAGLQHAFRRVLRPSDPFRSGIFPGKIWRDAKDGHQF